MEHEINFIHTADWHLGKPFAGIEDPVKRSRVQQERLESVRRIQRVVRERKAQFVVIAGDLFDSVTPTHATISAGLGAISELGVPVFVIPGNHDYGGPESLWDQPFFLREQQRIAPNFVLLAERTHSTIPVKDQSGNEVNVALFPCPLLRRHESDDPTAWLREYDFSKVGESPRIVIAHGSTIDFADGLSHEDEEGLMRSSNTIFLERLPKEEVDYNCIISHANKNQNSFAGIGIDSQTSLHETLKKVDHGFVQGNFDELKILADSNEFYKALDHFIEGMLALSQDERVGWVCGLGHGINKDTPEKHVKHFVSQIRQAFK